MFAGRRTIGILAFRWAPPKVPPSRTIDYYLDSSRAHIAQLRERISAINKSGPIALWSYGSNFIVGLGKHDYIEVDIVC